MDIRDRLSREEVELISRTVRRTPEVFIKVLGRGGQDPKAVGRHLAYLNRGGDVEIDPTTLAAPSCRLACHRSLSIVVTVARPTLAIGRTHERFATPSMCTVHAPQRLAPQPYWVPFRARVSRSTRSRGVSASTSTGRSFPFDLLRCNSRACSRNPERILL